MVRADRDDKAVAWHTRAAERGHTGATYALGSWARDGIVGPPDNVVALGWFLRMFLAGHARRGRVVEGAGVPSVGEVSVSQVHRGR
jgi:TPR repeat protein